MALLPHISDLSCRGVSDEDVLDTWFSSGIFPFSIFGWPNEVSRVLVCDTLHVRLNPLNTLIDLTPHHTHTHTL